MIDRELAIFLNVILFVEFGDNWINSGRYYVVHRDLRSLRHFAQSIALIAIVTSTLIRTLFAYFGTSATVAAAKPPDTSTAFVTFLLWGIALVVGTVSFITWRRQ